MSKRTAAVFEHLTSHVRQTGMLASIESLLGWDERCLMPVAAADYRADQVALLSGLVHERKTDPRLGDWLNELADSDLATDPASDTGATVRQLKREYDKQSKIPKALVEELSRTAVLGQQTWQEARARHDFAAFAPLLEKTIELKRQQAEAVGYADVLYDALLDDFEQDETTSNMAAVLEALRRELVPFVAAIGNSSRQSDVSILTRHYPVDVQEQFGRQVAARIGFDFDRGRLDVTTHPFCSGMGPDDCRITTRYDAQHFNGGFFGILHEAGHGIYEQGLPGDQFGLPLGQASSMGIHESQSRMWENLVGRSRPFWEFFYPDAQRAYPNALGDTPLDDFYFAVNDVRPSLIRVEADEATYNLHILIRFELEQELFADRLQVADLPEAWNTRYRDDLGITPPNDALGVLQDIHWSAGLFGYFPTYTLGNLYASQFFQQADADLGGLAEQFAKGQFQPLHDWLKTHIHTHGQRYSAGQLCQKITGNPLSHQPLMAHLREKLGPLYGLD